MRRAVLAMLAVVLVGGFLAAPVSASNHEHFENVDRCFHLKRTYSDGTPVLAQDDAEAHALYSECYWNPDADVEQLDPPKPEMQLAVSRVISTHEEKVAFLETLPPGEADGPYVYSGALNARDHLNWLDNQHDIWGDCLAVACDRDKLEELVIRQR